MVAKENGYSDLYVRMSLSSQFLLQKKKRTCTDWLDSDWAGKDAQQVR